jgi:hypothetical protein
VWLLQGRFGGTYRVHRQGKLIKEQGINDEGDTFGLNVGSYKSHTASHPKNDILQHTSIFPEVSCRNMPPCFYIKANISWMALQNGLEGLMCDVDNNGDLFEGLP